MKKLIIAILLATLYACHTTINIPTTNTIAPMEKFDIETFNKNKNPSFEWYIETEDIEIKRLYTHYEDTYTEIITHKNEFYSEYKLFYSNGSIKMRGKHYNHNNSFFRVSIWEYYHIDGKLIKTVDEDQTLKTNYKKALEIARKEYSLYPADVEIFLQNGYWYIYNVKGNRLGSGTIIDCNTGKHKRFIMKIGGH